MPHPTKNMKYQLLIQNASDNDTPFLMVTLKTKAHYINEHFIFLLKTLYVNYSPINTNH